MTDRYAPGRRLSPCEEEEEEEKGDNSSHSRRGQPPVEVFSAKMSLRGTLSRGPDGKPIGRTSTVRENIPHRVITSGVRKKNCPRPCHARTRHDASPSPVAHLLPSERTVRIGAVIDTGPPNDHGMAGRARLLDGKRTQCRKWIPSRENTFTHTHMLSHTNTYSPPSLRCGWLLRRAQSIRDAPLAF
ncbi:hypothetical protein LX36DRAFT_208703 [Colletotrichum falcatum]|nr:hypothetical protein LX36DRAFT_208703 [Colletotrichum falcatum]